MAEKQEVTNFLAEEKSFLSGFKKQIAMALTVTTFAVTTPAFSQESKGVSTVDTTKKTEQTLTTSKEIDQQDPSYTEKVMMPDGTAFMVSKEELVLLEKYKVRLNEGDFATESEMLESFKTTILQKRKNAKILAETQQIKAEKEQIEQNIAKTDGEIAQIKAEKEQIAKKLQEVNSDIASLNTQFKEIFEKQLGKKLSDQEVQVLIKEVQVWDQAIDADTKVVDKLVQAKKENGSLTQEQKLQLIALEKKWSTYKISLPYAQSTMQSLVSTIKNTLGDSKTLVYNK